MKEQQDKEKYPPVQLVVIQEMMLSKINISGISKENNSK